MPMNTANKLTLARVFMIPLFLVIAYWGFPGSRYVALGVYILACLTDLLDEIPVDACRYFFNAKPETQMEFDLGLAVREDSENPVYYVQYAHARICSVLKKLESEGVKFEGADAVDASVLTDPAEQALIRLLAAFPAEIAAAAEKYDPARITRYCIDVASAYHRFYNACRILDAEGAVQQGRIALCLAVRGVIHNILTMFKVNAPETM